MLRRPRGIVTEQVGADPADDDAPEALGLARSECSNVAAPRENPTAST